MPEAASLSKHHFDSARVLREAGNTYEALAHLRLAYVYAPSDEEKEKALLERGQAYRFLKNDHEAALSFRIFLKLFPNSAQCPAVHRYLAESLFRLHRPTESLSQYEKADDSAATILGKANALHALGRYSEAHELYIAVLSRDRELEQSSPEAMYWAGENARFLGKRADAKAYLGAVNDDTLGHSRDHTLGLIAIDEGDYTEAIKRCTAAGNSAEQEVRRKSLLCLAEASGRLGSAHDRESFLLELRRGHAVGIERDSALLSLAQLYRSQTRHDDALSLLKELVFRHQPGKAALDEVESLLIEARDRNPARLPELWKAVGRSLLHPSRSQTLLDLAEALKPDVREFLRLCRWLAANGTDEAKTTCRIWLSDYYASVGDTASALLHMRNIAVKAGDDASRVQARLAAAEGQPERALSHLQHIREMRRDDVAFLSSISKRMAPNDAMLALYERVLKDRDAPAGLHMEYADLLCRAGRSSESIGHYRHAIETSRAGTGPDADQQQWGQYRIATLMGGRQSEEALQNISKSGVIGRLAEVSLKELQVDEIMRRIK